MQEVQCTKLLHFITYPDVVYKVATATILIQTRGIQSVLILEKEVVIWKNDSTNHFPLKFTGR